MAKRYELTDAQWRRTADLVPGKAGDPGRSGADNRQFVNGVLWVLRSGAHWHDLPERYGSGPSWMRIDGTGKVTRVRIADSRAASFKSAPYAPSPLGNLRTNRPSTSIAIECQLFARSPKLDLAKYGNERMIAD